jgi:DNA-binding transcriptional regulator YiaG
MGRQGSAPPASHTETADGPQPHLQPGRRQVALPAMDGENMRRMTAGEVRVARASLGMNPQEFGDAIGIAPRSVQNFEWAKLVVSPEVAGRIRALQKYTRERVESLAAYLHENPEATVVVFSDNSRDRLPEEVPAAYKDVAKYGAGWWRTVVARATEDLPDVRVGTPTEMARYGENWWEAVTQRPVNRPPTAPH